MINLRTKKQKKRLQRELVGLAIIYQNRLYRRLHAAIGRQYLDAARLLEWEIEGIDCAINEQSTRIKRILFIYAKIISDFFLNKLYNLLTEVDVQKLSSKKKFKENFSKKTIQWFLDYSDFNTRKINQTTKKRIKFYIDKRREEGASLRRIAKELRKKDRRARVQSIARTVTHTLMIYSIDSIMQVNGYKSSEWICSENYEKKKRKFNHKKANGERVKKGMKFIRTGEELDFPGDPKGSIANIAHCNCVLCYFLHKTTLSKDRRLFNEER